MDFSVLNLTRKALALLTAIVLALCTGLPLGGCSSAGPEPSGGSVSEAANPSASTPEAAEPASDAPPADAVDSLPEYSGQSYVEINGNEPFFEHEEESLPEGYETYAPLDLLGRCGTAQAIVGQETMPTGERGDISDVRPSGWEQERYDFVDGGSLYNRSHLIGWQLTGEDANEDNLITGTRHLNADIMEPLESAVADYVHQTGNHVRYRVTPVFEGEELVARGVLMEAKSLEDGGAGIRFCVYAFNVQPGVDIDYTTGANWANGQSTATDSISESVARGSGVADGRAVPPPAGAQDGAQAASSPAQDYVLNENSRKFHEPGCASVEDVKPENRRDVHCPREELIEQGYDPCGRCNP